MCFSFRCSKPWLKTPMARSSSFLKMQRQYNVDPWLWARRKRHISDHMCQIHKVYLLHPDEVLPTQSMVYIVAATKRPNLQHDISFEMFGEFPAICCVHYHTKQVAVYKFALLEPNRFFPHSITPSYYRNKEMKRRMSFLVSRPTHLWKTVGIYNRASRNLRPNTLVS